MKLYCYVGPFAFLSGFLSCFPLLSHPPSFQTYQSSSFWEQYEKTTHDDIALCKKRFVEDAQRWSPANDLVPPHSFQPNPSILRIVTYNVRFWTDAFDRFNFEKTIQTLRALQADILILQEVAWAAPFNTLSLSTLLKPLREHGYLFGGQETFCPIGYADSNFGVMILSRFPLAQIICKRFAATLPNADREGYVHALVHLENHTVSVYGTHLAVESVSKNPEQCEALRTEQLKQLAQAAQEDQASVVVIGGDFNALRPQDYNFLIEKTLAWDLIQQACSASFNFDYQSYALNSLDAYNFYDSFNLLGIPTPKVSSWRGVWLDHLFLKKSPTVFKLKGSYLYFSDASDHFPVICDLRLLP